MKKATIRIAGTLCIVLGLIITFNISEEFVPRVENETVNAEAANKKMVKELRWNQRYTPRSVVKNSTGRSSRRCSASYIIS